MSYQSGPTIHAPQERHCLRIYPRKTSSSLMHSGAQGYAGGRGLLPELAQPTSLQNPIGWLTIGNSNNNRWHSIRQPPVIGLVAYLHRNYTYTY